jgi:hypothetical protein
MSPYRWALLALALQSPSLFPCQLAAGTTRRGDLGVSVPVFLSPTARHLPIHLLAVVSVRPTLHLRERMGWWGGRRRRSEREEGMGGFWE